MIQENNAEINYGRILKIALDIAERMLVNGTEVGRVEDSIARICRAYGAVRVDALTITTSIIVTIETPDGECVTQTRRIEDRSNDLLRIEALNRLSREICTKKPDTEWISKKLEQIDEMRRLPWFVSLIAYLSVGSSFAVFFGGTWRDAIAALLASFVIFAFDRLAGNLKANKIVYTLIVSLVAGIICVYTVRFGIGQNLDFIMIGTIMLLIPGMAITGAIEDLLVGDTITGLLRLCESILTACAIAAGFVFATYICQSMDLLNVGNSSIDPIIQLAMAVLSALGFAVKLGMKRPSRLIAASFAGLFGWGSYLICAHLGADGFTSCFVASAVGALYSQVMARVLRAPATVFLVPAVIPLVPGRALYYTMSNALQGNSVTAESWAATTAAEALAIAFGMVAILFAVGVIVTVIRRRKIRKKIYKIK